MKILIAGFQHETNTFAPTKARYENFLAGEGHPGLMRGEKLFELIDVNLPLGGFLKEAKALGHEVVPVIWAAASPSAEVTRDAFERIAGEIVDAATQKDFDAIYLDLHGAMVCEHVDDGEGELLARLRTVVGPDVPITASLDLHANVTRRMLANASVLVAYRTYPHVDMAVTGAATARLLHRMAESSAELHCHSRDLPFLIPINGMCTLVEPAASLYARLESLETDGVWSLSYCPGFPAADFPGCGPTIWGYGTDAEAVRRAVDALYDQCVNDEADWGVKAMSAEDAVRAAVALTAGVARKCVVIADTQDNPGAGGDSNTTGMLRELVRQDARHAAIGLMWDAAAAEAAHAAGVGAIIDIALGGTSGVPGDSPFHGRFRVEHLSDGDCVFGGPMLTGVKTNLGLCAGLSIGGVQVVVSSSKAQMLDRNLFRLGGVDPERMRILVNKSSVHFRADFSAIADLILVAKSPGPAIADPAELPWKRIPVGMRTSPGGRAFGA